MKRGEIWTAAGTGYATKPRPVIIIQDDYYNDSKLGSVLVIPVTSKGVNAPTFRVSLSPGDQTGLFEDSYAMVDKTLAVPKDKLGNKLGAVANKDLKEIERVLLLIFGLAR